MAYTVKKVAALSGVSVRTLHFYDETGLLRPAYVGANGYRYYKEAQLLMLQQILFYRELGFELKAIGKILKRPDFEKVTALQSHRKVLQKNLSRTSVLIETIDKTIQHLKGAKKMQSEEMFIGFSVGAGRDRFGRPVELGGAPVECKVSGKDTNGALCVFELVVGWPRHIHLEQDEWIYIVEGEVAFEVGGKRFRAGAGESVFIPRKVPHGLAPENNVRSRMLHVFQPAGRMEEFFREVAKVKNLPTREQVINKSYTIEQIKTLHRVFGAYGMDLLPPLEP